MQGMRKPVFHRASAGGQRLSEHLTTKHPGAGISLIAPPKQVVFDDFEIEQLGHSLVHES